MIAMAGAQVPGRAVAAGAEGVWYGLRSDGVSGKVKADHYTFLPDGRAFRRAPTEGLGIPVDMALECRYAECGTFESRGGEVIFRNATSGTSTQFALDEEGVLRKAAPKISYRRMHLLDGPLNGTWGLFDPNGGPPVVSLTLRPDGSFKEEGLLRFSAWAALAPPGEDRSGRAVERGEGVYSVRRGTLELRYRGGTVARFFLATPPAVAPGASPPVLHLGGARLDKAPG
ncbi:MAG: hypothetical protein C0481_19510 [Phenylobacterium sp.]|uniref:hypothetical protein n=1 Tax=Phenylobacterium sp. TaxID=1871053 RepID=UPI0025E03809|nr:hypothetical protein [Phenylobacterium sp.]MBA4014056.1 hypothetical protein [Phenylobacterium sp.]